MRVASLLWDRLRLLWLFAFLVIVFIIFAIHVVLIFATQWLIGAPAAIALATTVVLGVLGAEVGCALWWLGERFEHLDLSAELRP